MTKLEKKKTEFDEFVEELQKRINEEERKTFSEKVLEEYNHPYNFGRMENPSTIGKIKGKCGEIELFLKIDKNRVINATFFTDGCGATVACGSMICKLIQNKKIEDVSKITKEALIEALNGLPAENEHCADSFILALRIALKNYKK